MWLQEQEQAKSLEYFRQLADLLRSQGVPEMEIFRAIQSQIVDPNVLPLAFPGPITGIDLAGSQPHFLVPDTGSPPVFVPNPETSTDFIPSVGPQGYLSLPTPDPLGSVKTNSPVYDVNGSNIGHTYNIVNPPYQGDMNNWLGLANDVNSEPPTLGVTGFNFEKTIPEWRYPIEQSQSEPLNVPPIAIYPSGAIREAIQNIRREFNWLEDSYLSSAKKVAEENGAKVYLIRAAEETITDHRAEGEEHLRRLAGDELMMMTRTAVNKGTDINHYGPDFRTNGMVVDAEYDMNLKQLQFLVIESDPEINAAIDNGTISDVSINGGAPRTETVEPCFHDCATGECQLCNVPRGVILGELDDIAFTWVVSSPMMWKGKHIPKATPGVKTTAIQAI